MKAKTAQEIYEEMKANPSPRKFYVRDLNRAKRQAEMEQDEERERTAFLRDLAEVN